jgi:hypothetical protein
MRSAASWEFISSWQQRIVVGRCTDMPTNATLPRWHHVPEQTCQTLILLNDVNSTVAVSKVTDVATMRIEAWQRPRSGGWLAPVSLRHAKIGEHSSRWCACALQVEHYACVIFVVVCVLGGIGKWRLVNCVIVCFYYIHLPSVSLYIGPFNSFCCSET